MIEEARNIKIEDYNYELPQEFIAQKPVENRDESKILLTEDGEFGNDVFKNISEYIDKDSLLVFNDTKVIRARLIFYKNTGAKIEVFLLEPVSPVSDISRAFIQKNEVVWKAYIGNAKKWKKDALTTNIKTGDKEIPLKAEMLGSEADAFLVKFSWPENLSFADIIEKAGNIPLPPYMKRESDAEDILRYQTVYAKNKGSVAAPTAGLHFTKKVFDKLENKGVDFKYISLHVGAGTFKAVDSETVDEHTMHREKVIIQKSFIDYLLENTDKKLYAVGTTTTRSLESMYWHGVKLLKGITDSAEMSIEQWEAYDLEKEKVSLIDSLNAIKESLSFNKLDSLRGETQLIIVPSYNFKVVNHLITNFHQPKSTLLLLVSAFYGDKWKLAYEYAKKNNFRFLSYGDSCLF